MKMTTGKPCFSAKGGTPPISSAIPKGGAGFKSSSAQTSGKTREARKGGNYPLTGMPKVNTGGSQTHKDAARTSSTKGFPVIH